MMSVIKEVELRDGLRLPYVEHGDPSGTPVLLLHGLTDSCRSFEYVLAHLPRHIHAIALSQRGHGDADRPAAGYRMGDFAADLAAFMDVLEMPRAVVVGHSMECQVAQRFALDHPMRVLALVLIDGFATPSRNPAVLELRDQVSGLTDPVEPGFAAEFQHSTVARPVPETFLDTAIRESLKVPSRVWHAALAGMMADDLLPELGRIAVPTLLLWGDRDTLIPLGDQQALAAAIPDARLKIYPGAGHAPHWEDPATVAADLAEFVERVVVPT